MWNIASTYLAIKIMTSDYYSVDGGGTADRVHVCKYVGLSETMQMCAV